MSALPASVIPGDGAVAKLRDWLDRHRRIFVLTGAGCSTDSGIPDYRDANGSWKRRPPILYQDFIGGEPARRRYWARSLAGWPAFASARPNRAHRALATLETAGFIHQLVTQNVDGLHQQAGSRRVIDLHGRLDTVVCLQCPYRESRDVVQERMRADNPGFAVSAAALAPDGDADVERVNYSGFHPPDCPRCGGILKPSVVFFGEAVPKSRVEQARQRLREAGALLVVGSSLTVFSGYRFCKIAADQGQPIAAVNLGRTRADDELTLKANMPCETALDELLTRLGVTANAPDPTNLAPASTGPITHSNAAQS